MTSQLEAAMGIEISITEFKAKCLDLIDKLSRHEIDSIEITKRGKTVAVVNAKEPAKPRTLEEAITQMKAWQESKTVHVTIPPGFDWDEPLVRIEDFDAYHGRLMSQDD